MKIEIPAKEHRAKVGDFIVLKNNEIYQIIDIEDGICLLDIQTGEASDILSTYIYTDDLIEDLKEKEGIKYVLPNEKMILSYIDKKENAHFCTKEEENMEEIKLNSIKWELVSFCSDRFCDNCRIYKKCNGKDGGFLTTEGIKNIPTERIMELYDEYLLT